MLKGKNVEWQIMTKDIQMKVINAEQDKMLKSKKTLTGKNVECNKRRPGQNVVK